MSKGILLIIATLLITQIQARTLAARNINVCVEKKKAILKLNTQPRYWKMDGVGSHLLAHRIRGRHAILTADIAQANVKAYCQNRGSQRFNLEWKLNSGDPTTYNMNITVNCISCGDPKGIKKVKVKVKNALKYADVGKDETARRLLEEALEMIEKLREREVLTPDEEEAVDDLEKEILEIFNEEVVHKNYGDFEVVIVNEDLSEATEIIKNEEYEYSEVEEESNEENKLKKYLDVLGL